MDASHPTLAAEHVAPWWWRDFLLRFEKRPRYQPLMLVAAVFIAGIFVDRWLGTISAETWFGIAAGAWIAWAIFAKLGWPRMASTALLLSITAGGAAWGHVCWRLYPTTEVGRYAVEMQRPIVVEAEILTAPRIFYPGKFDPLAPARQNTRTRFDARVLSVRDGLSWRKATGRVSCTAETKTLDNEPSDSFLNRTTAEYQATLDALQPGDRIRLLAFIEKIPVPLNPGEFDFAAHARGDCELCRLRTDIPNGVQVTKAAAWYWPGTWLPQLRRYGSQLLWNNLSHEQAGLASAVLLGTREQMPYEQTEDFLVTGTIHILSISGLHVGLLAWVLFKGMQLGWIRRGRALFGVALITLAYTIMTDSEPPAVRATVLVWIVCLSLLCGRPGLAFNSLGASAIVVLLLNPNDLFRAGPQLSFLSMGVLSWLAAFWSGPRVIDPLERLIEQTQPWYERALWWSGRWLALGLFSGTMIWLVTLPLVMSRFYIVSPAALLLNILLSPFVAVAMVCGFLVLATGWWAPWLAALFGWLSDLSLNVLYTVVHAAALTPGSHVWVSGPSDRWLLGFYIGLAAWAVLRTWLPGWKLGVPLLLAYCALGWGEAVYNHNRDPGLRVTFIAVGHGGAALIECPDGRALLYDCGRLGAPILAERAVEAVLRSRGIRRLDALILSHADTDHYNGVPELLRRFHVTQVIVTDQMFQKPAGKPLTAGVVVLQQTLERYQVAVTTLRAGQELYPDDSEPRLRVLHPPLGGVEKIRPDKEADNANSLVLEIAQGEQRLLLTGDLEDRGMDAAAGTAGHALRRDSRPAPRQQQQQPGRHVGLVHPKMGDPEQQHLRRHGEVSRDLHCRWGRMFASGRHGRGAGPLDG